MQVLKVNRRATKVKAKRGTLVDVNGMGAVTWSWERKTRKGWVEVGPEKRELKFTKKVRGKKIRSVVTFTDGGGFEEIVRSRALRVPKKQGVRPRPNAVDGP